MYLLVKNSDRNKGFTVVPVDHAIHITIEQTKVIVRNATGSFDQYDRDKVVGFLEKVEVLNKILDFNDPFKASDKPTNLNFNVIPPENEMRNGL